MKKIVAYLVILSFLISMMPPQIYAQEKQSILAQSSVPGNRSQQNNRESPAQELAGIEETPAVNEETAKETEQSQILTQPETEIEAEDILEAKTGGRFFEGHLEVFY
ncbi:MAG: hypothetical protein AAGU27_28700 [Dehalobacterium sp.]